MFNNCYTSHCNQLLSIRKLCYAEGPAKGTDVYMVDNNSGLSFEVLPDRAMDIGALRFGGRLVSYISSVGVTHPAFYEPRGEGWLRSFGGGFLTTCGLDQAGNPCIYKGQSYGMHGRISNIPAQYVFSAVEQQGDMIVGHVGGTIYQTGHQMEHLELKRTITTYYEKNQILIEDTITNHAAQISPFMIVYHFNFGFPFLDSQIKLELGKHTVKMAIPPDSSLYRFGEASGKKDLDSFTVLKMLPDASGRSNARIINERQNLCVELDFDTKALPYLTIWKMLQKNNYVMGIEPCNNHIQGVGWEQANQTLRVLESGESVSHQLRISFLPLDKPVTGKHTSDDIRKDCL